MMITVERMVRTCSACPTQYDIHLSNGLYAYFRYRWGQWSLDLSPSKADWYRGITLASTGAKIGDDLDGILEESEVIGLLEIALPTVLIAANV